jgi:hypothetical protein
MATVKKTIYLIMSLLNDINNALNPSKIDDLKSTIGKRRGLATSNRFSVTVIPPTESLLNLGGLIGQGPIVNDPRDISILCDSCSLPGRLIQTGDYDAHGRNPRKYPQTIIEEDVEFVFTLTNDVYIKKMFDKWMESIIDPESHLVSYDSDYKTDTHIQLLDKNNATVYGVRLIDSYPTSVNSIALSNENTDAKTLVSVNMTYQRFVIESRLKSIINSTVDKFDILTRLI